mgnify:CR=1 FL=1
MKKHIIIPLSLMLSVGLLAGAGTVVHADGTGDVPYLALGADLNKEEKATVLRLLDVDEDDLDEYKTITITNQDEHDYLDSYLSSKVIGDRALSSVFIEREDEGEGIDVTTKNITYCTDGMYENALTTAGIRDAEVVVAGPFNITGTAALVGTMKAYEEMTGETLSKEAKDTATNELVVTGEIAETIGDAEKAEQLLAYVKQEISKEDIKSKEGIEKVIDEGCEVYGISLSEDEKAELTDLALKLGSLDLDYGVLKQQAKDIYSQLKDMDIDTKGLFDLIKSILKQLLGD